MLQLFGIRRDGRPGIPFAAPAPVRYGYVVPIPDIIILFYPFRPFQCPPPSLSLLSFRPLGMYFREREMTTTSSTGYGQCDDEFVSQSKGAMVLTCDPPTPRCLSSGVLTFHVHPLKSSANFLIAFYGCGNDIRPVPGHEKDRPATATTTRSSSDKSGDFANS